jgi:hypothetical protein
MKLRLMLFTFTATLAMAADADFGVTSITSFETARLTAFCRNDAERTGAPPDPCDVLFEFHGIQGRSLKRSVMTLPPGTGAFLDLRGAEAGATSTPGEIIPCFKVGRGVAVVSFQTFDNFTTRSNLLLNWADRSMALSGDLDFGPAGITPLDTARLGAFCPDEPTRTGLPPDPCDVTFLFHDLRGRLVKQSQMTLKPGTGGSLDLRSAEVGSTGGRVEIIPCIKVGRGVAVGSVRVLDNFTGHATVLAYPAVPAQ